MIERRSKRRSFALNEKKSLRSLETILKVDHLFCTSSSWRRLAERHWCNRRVVVNAITDGLRLLSLSRWHFLPFLPPSIPRFSFASFSFLTFTRRISRNLASRSTDIFRFAAWVNGNDHSSRNTSRPSLSYTRVNTRPTLHLDSLSSFLSNHRWVIAMITVSDNVFIEQIKTRADSLGILIRSELETR